MWLVPASLSVPNQVSYLYVANRDLEIYQILKRNYIVKKWEEKRMKDLEVELSWVELSSTEILKLRITKIKVVLCFSIHKPNILLMVYEIT